jgi:glycine betaine/proline transport system substrate-binding protein
VQFPEYAPECYKDPKWGINPDMAYDCGKPHGEIWKYANIEMKTKWPVAYRVAKNYTIDAKELGLLGAQVDLEGKTIEEVADAWIKANEAKWKAWVDGSS